MQMDDARKVASSRQVCAEFELGCAKENANLFPKVLERNTSAAGKGDRPSAKVVLATSS